MLLVETELRPSPIHGIGVFSLERIPKGEVIWRFDPYIDKILHESDLEGFTKATISHFWDEGEWYFGSLDHIGYTNTSDTPNTLCVGTQVVAWKNIEIGEELTFNYESHLYLNILKEMNVGT